MSIEINKSNYEEFYLDFLEGNLSGEVLLAFEAFLAENPELAVEDDLIMLEPELSADEESYSPFDKLLLKKQVDISELNESNIDYFLISSTENLLSEKDLAVLDKWLDKNPKYRRDAALVAATRSEADLSVVYDDKEALKHKTRIIPMWWSGVAAAAAAVLLFIAFSWNTGEIDASTTKTAKADTDTTAETPLNGNTEPLPAQTDKPPVSTPGRKIKKQDTGNLPEQNPLKKKAAAIDGLEIRKAVVPTRPAQLAEVPVQEKQPENAVQPEAVTYAAVDKMSNPIQSVTKVISEKLDTPVDFRTAKASKKQGGGFYLKLGKLEVSHTTASMH